MPNLDVLGSCDPYCVFTIEGKHTNLRRQTTIGRGKDGELKFYLFWNAVASCQQSGNCCPLFCVFICPPSPFNPKCRLRSCVLCSGFDLAYHKPFAAGQSLRAENGMLEVWWSEHFDCLVRLEPPLFFSLQVLDQDMYAPHRYDECAILARLLPLFMCNVMAW